MNITKFDSSETIFIFFQINAFTNRPFYTILFYSGIVVWEMLTGKKPKDQTLPKEKAGY